jgi:hypothetical protein
MEQSTGTLNDWVAEYEAEQQQSQQYEKLPKISVKDGEVVTFKILDEGKKVKTKFGESILFVVEHNQARQYWWVKTNQYAILTPLVKNKPLTGRTLQIMRMGSTKDDTRYSVKFLDSQAQTKVVQ